MRGASLRTTSMGVLAALVVAPGAMAAPAPEGRAAAAAEGSFEASILYAKYRAGTLHVAVKSSRPTERLRIVLHHKRGHVVRTVERTVETNYKQRIRGLSRSRAIGDVVVSLI